MTRQYYYSRPETVVADVKYIDPMLVALLAKCTVHPHEHHIVDYIMRVLNGTNHKIDNLGGNLLIQVGDAEPETMFSCHMDIVGDNYKKNTENGLVDRIVLMTPKDYKTNKSHWGMLYGAKTYADPVTGEITKFENSTLGADDKVGVFLCLKMILEKIPGLYAFHIGEECGGIGSLFLTKNHKQRFEKIKRAIAFDRAGYTDVIEHQRGGRCCSTEFGKALAELLNTNMPKFEKYNAGIHGSFTDTANYRDIIPECTNISVGYFNQHGVNEHLDYVWLMHILLPAVLKADFNSLPTVRDPKKVETYTTYGNNWSNYSNNSNFKRKTWKEATNTTVSWELPAWTPQDGWVAEANEGVLERAIIEAFQKCYSFEDKAKLGKYVFELLEMRNLLETEIEVLIQQNKMLLNKEKYGTVEDIDIFKKKKFLQELIRMCEGHEIENHNNILHAYCKGGEQFLKRHEGNIIPEQFTRKELRRLNKMIVTIAYYLSIDDFKSEVNVEYITELEHLLQEISQYITLHIEEEGFNQPVEKNKKSEPKRIIAVH